MITVVGLFPAVVFVSGMGFHTVPMALFLGVTGLAAAGGGL